MDPPQLSQVPGYQLFIGGTISLKRREALASANITHIVTVVDWKVTRNVQFNGYKHLHVPVDDVAESNLIEWFPRSNSFIQEALNRGQTEGAESTENAPSKPNGVLVHCMMGISRSATVILAYLLWASNRKTRDASKTNSSVKASHPEAPSRADDSDSEDGMPLTSKEALALLRQGRPIADPNDGFIEQLELYHKMGCPDNVEAHPQYQRWLYQKSLQAKRELEIAPELDFIKFEDELEEAKPSECQATEKSEVEVKCRRCRRLLVGSQFLVEHEFPETPAAQQQITSSECAHIFVQPLSWMKPVLGDSRLDGRLICPGANCQVNVGKFAWQGLKCSCGKWVTPGFGLARSKVDQIVVGNREGGKSGALSGRVAYLGPNVRLPPGMKGKQDVAL